MTDARSLPLDELAAALALDPGDYPEREHLFRTLADAAPGFVWLADDRGRCLWANRTWEEYTGSNLRQLNDGGWDQFNHPEEVAQIHARWEHATAAGIPFEMELRYRRHDGEYRWMLARVVPLLRREGEEQRWVGTSVDIHDLKKTQDELQRSRRELADFFDNAAIGLHSVDRNGVILRVNQSELDLLGYRRDEYVGRNIADFHADADVIQDILRRLTAGEVLHDYPARLRCKDGSIKHVLIDSSVLFVDGEFAHTRCFTRDITAQRQIQESAARLAAIVASSSDAIIGKTLQGVITSWNAAAERIFGFTAAEMIGESILRIIPEELHEAEGQLLAQIARGEPLELWETIRCARDGSRLHVSVSVSPIRDPQDRVVGVSSIMRDMTERKRAQEMLAQSQERLQLALKAARMGIWHWDVPAGVLSWDEGLERLYDLPPGEKITGYEQFLQRVHPEDRPYVEKSIERATRRADELDYEFRIVLPNGRIRWLADQSRLVRDPDGKVLSLTGICLDITERKQVEERLRQAQRMESVGQLAGGIAHEANNMMSVVLGCADYVLQRSDLSEPVRQDVEQIWRAAKRTAGVTQQLLAFSRRQVLQPQVIDLNDTVRGLEPILSRTLGESSGLRLHLSPQLGKVRADPGQLEQVLINLTLNARDAMSSGGRLTIETMNVFLDERYVAGKPVDTLQPGEFAALIVTDTGHGMDQDTLGKVFEPFFTTKGVGEGTGLGLSTAYGIVKQSGGFIWAYSEPGLGTTFKLYFPLIESSAGSVEGMLPVLPGQAEEVVLIVEDESMVRSIMARTLRESGYTVLEASDGREALELLDARGTAVSLVVADVVMRGMGGRELSTKLAERWPQVPVLFTSGYTGLDVVRRGLMEEGCEFIQKPLAPEALIRKVRQMVSSKESPS
ncbi:MAG TPA: PAS domain S-box protein [Gemmatimonadales bacterium]|nr:PAS domain S-box protein [Gemmatimonadales bacterium]